MEEDNITLDNYEVETVDISLDEGVIFTQIGIEDYLTAEELALIGELDAESLEALLDLLGFFASLFSENEDGFDNFWGLGLDFANQLDLGSALGGSWNIGTTPQFTQNDEYARIITNIQEMYYFGVVALSESHRITEDYYFITRIVRLPFNAPEVIRLDGFELDGFVFDFVSLDAVGDNGITRKEHETTIYIQTGSSDINQIMSELPWSIQYQTDDGYIGLLHLIEDSIVTVPAESEWVRSYLYHTITYENVLFGDTDSFTTFFARSGIAFSLYDIDWQLVHEGLEDDTDLSYALFNAVVTYRGWYSTTTIPYFTTYATFQGTLQNFEHFPSALYEINFAARLRGLDEDADSNILSGLYYVDTSAETQATVQGDAQEENSITGVIITAIIFAAILVAFYTLYKIGIFTKIFSSLKRKFHGVSDDDEPDDEDEDGDDDRHEN